MQYASLTAGEKRIYNRTITQSHERRIHVHVQTLDGDPVSSLTPVILDGSVAHDVSSDVSNAVLTLRFVDPFGVVNFEPTNPGGASLHRKFRVQVVDARRVPELGDWVEHDVHTGPIWDFSSSEGVVSITAHSVDRLARGTIRHPRAWPRKTRKTTVIRDLLSAAGAVHLRIPDLPATTNHPVTVGFAYRHHKKHVKAKGGHKAHNVTVTNREPRTDHYFEKADELADSANRYLYADTSGVFCLKPYPHRPILKVDRELLAEPMLTRPGVDAPNEWLVIGAKPKGTKKRVKARVALPPANDLSAQSLAWNGKPYVVEDRIENPHLHRTAECKAVGIRHRDRAARVNAELECDLLPIPWLSDFDMITVPTQTGRATLLLKQWTYPLTPDSTPMHIGSTVKPRPISGVTSVGVG